MAAWVEQASPASSGASGCSLGGSKPANRCPHTVGSRLLTETEQPC